MENNQSTLIAIIYFEICDSNLEALTEQLQLVTESVRTSKSSISNELYEYDIVKNMDYNNQKKQIFPDGFLFFKYKLEIYSRANDKLDDIDTVSKVLHFFWNNNIPAVTSSDYEDLLPEKGGYNTSSLPWIEGNVNSRDFL